MHFYGIAVIALIIGADLRQPAHLYQGEGNLNPQQQFISSNLPPPASDVPITLEATADGKGDIDCYIMVQDEKDTTKWHVLAMDESQPNACYIHAYINTPQPIKLWIINNGEATTKYSVVVDQTP